MALTVDQITAEFPFKFFTIIKVEADCQSIHDICTLLYSNASTFLTTLVGGNHKHISLVMQDTIYATILPIPYNAPMDPGGTVQVPSQATSSVFS